MTATTETVREQAVVPLDSDIPAGMTIAEYRARRRRPSRSERAGARGRRRGRRERRR